MWVVAVFVGMLIYWRLGLITDAQERQADALEDIAHALDATLFDDDEDGPSDCTRIVTALEKIAGIEPPLTPPPDGPGTTE